MKVIPPTIRGIILQNSAKDCDGYSSIFLLRCWTDRYRRTRRLTDESSSRIIPYRDDESRGKVLLKIHKRKAQSSFKSRQWGKGPGQESRFSYTGDSDKNGWSMQSGVTEGKGSWGGKGGLVMTRDLFVDLTRFVQKSKCSAVESHKGGPFPRTFPGIIHLPKRKRRRRKRSGSSSSSSRMRRKRSRRRTRPDRNFLRRRAGVDDIPYIPITRAASSNIRRRGHTKTKINGD